MRLLELFKRPKATGVSGPLADSRAGQWPLDLPLVRFSEYAADTWTLADACRGVAILGENGSGKTSASGRHLARQYIKAGFGGLVLCFKTDEADLWRRYLQETGREQDGRFFGVDQELRFNFMDYEAQGSGIDFVENLVMLLVEWPGQSRMGVDPQLLVREEACYPKSRTKRKKELARLHNG